MWYCRTRSVGVGSESQIPTDLAQETEKQLPRERDGCNILNFGALPPFAPEERYVYSSATHPIPALQRSAMWYCRTRSVGVGFPNPLGEETSPPRSIPRRQLCRIYPQRGGMSHQDTGGTKIGT